MIAKGLKISGSTHTLVASVSAIVALNAAVALQFIGLDAQAALLATVFASMAFCTAMVATDLFSRSGQAVSSLRSMGATTGSISSAVVLAMIGYGVAGAAIGAALGGALGAGLGAGPGLLSLLIDSVAVIVISSFALIAGFYAGVRRAWRS